jgi:acetyltransferase-like isoleucine patch superfamily enzyme
MGNPLNNVIRVRDQVRLLVFTTRLQAVAKLHRASIDIDIAPDVKIGRRIDIQVDPGTHNRLVIGPKNRIRDDVVFMFKGGTIELGRGVEIRRGTTLNVSGRFSCAGGNVISYYNLIHCASSITLDIYASTNEYVSIIDSTHHHDGPNEFFYENVSAAPIAIGRNSWICNKSSVLMGVTVGHNSVVASHAVVNKDVPDGVVAGGVPAKVIAKRSVAGPALKFFDAPGEHEPASLPT